MLNTDGYSGTSTSLRWEFSIHLAYDANKWDKDRPLPSAYSYAPRRPGVLSDHLPPPRAHRQDTAPCHFLAKGYHVQIYHSGRLRRRAITSDNMRSELLVPTICMVAWYGIVSLALIARSQPSTAGVGHAKEPTPTEALAPPLFSLD
jgi:hypothetical protein